MEWIGGVEVRWKLLSFGNMIATKLRLWKGDTGTYKKNTRSGLV